MLSGEAANTNLIVFGLTRPGLEPTIYRTRSEHAIHYATDAVQSGERETPLVFLQHKYMSPNDDSYTDGLSLNVYNVLGIARMKVSIKVIISVYLFT